MSTTMQQNVVDLQSPTEIASGEKTTVNSSHSPMACFCRVHISRFVVSRPLASDRGGANIF